MSSPNNRLRLLSNQEYPMSGLHNPQSPQSSPHPHYGQTFAYPQTPIGTLSRTIYELPTFRNPSEENPDPLVFVSCYNRFDNLAHAPKGTPATATIYVYRLHLSTGTLTLLTVNDELMNPAFMRYHPTQNVLYACTEDITQDNQVAAFSVSGASGAISQLCNHSAEGKSTCYLTIDIPRKHLLFCNYWDSVIGTMPISPSGMIDYVSQRLVPPKQVVARDLKDHLANRQSEPHAHAIVLDPFLGNVGFVPDLGEDDLKQYVYDEESGRLFPTCSISCGPNIGKAHGPRYIEFHPRHNAVYVVNELSSTVSVFAFNASKGANLKVNSTESTLSFVQSISTIPSAYPYKLNTCGRICVDPSGKYVLVSNRGHNSIAVFKVGGQDSPCGEGGKLSIVNYCHTRGSTPRHFQFDPSGTFVISANQDTDSITLFRFDQTTGIMTYSGETYSVPSPNFVCIQQPHVTRRRSSPTVPLSLHSLANSIEHDVA